LIKGLLSKIPDRKIGTKEHKEKLYEYIKNNPDVENRTKQVKPFRRNKMDLKSLSFPEAPVINFK